MKGTASALVRDFWISTAGNLAVYLLLAVLRLPQWPFVVIAALAGTLLFLLVRNSRFLKVLFSGLRGYYFTFPPEENHKVWPRAQKSLRYFGISGASIGLDRFEQWLANCPASFRCRLLLMDPEAKCLPRQEAYKLGDGATPARIEDEVKAERAKITSTIERLKRLDSYKHQCLEIKLYDEFVPWWMYFFDDRELFLGVLPRGAPGIEAPVMVLRPHSKYATVYEAFNKTWERVWEQARDA